MKCIISTAALVCAWMSSAAAQIVVPGPDIPKNPQIEVGYTEPRDPTYRPIYERLTQLRALETLQQFLSPLKLPRNITVKVDECGGALTLPYEPGGSVVICYEYIREIEANVPSEGGGAVGRGRPPLTAAQARVGAFVQLVLQQMAYPVLETLQIPVWGRLEEAADNVAGFIMLEFGDEVAWTTVVGSAWFLAQRGLLGSGFFADVARPTEAQRFYNYLCLAYGREPPKYQFLVDVANLHPERAKYCPQDYRKLRYSFRTTIMQHVDQGLLERVQAKQDWLPRSLPEPR